MTGTSICFLSFFFSRIYNILKQWTTMYISAPPPPCYKINPPPQLHINVKIFVSYGKNMMAPFLPPLDWLKEERDHLYVHAHFGFAMWNLLSWSACHVRNNSSSSSSSSSSSIVGADTFGNMPSIKRCIAFGYCWIWWGDNVIAHISNKQPSWDEP